MIPVALFAYARPKHLLKTLGCLRANRVPLIYAFSDGPRTSDKVERVVEVRRVLREVDWCEVVLTERPENLGLGRSVRTGVAEVLRRHESLIVVEDDLVCVEGTYAYLSAALEHYRDDARVMSVTGWTHPRITPVGVGELPYFDGRAECLVWGTWRRAWQGMEEDALTLIARCRQRGIDPYLYGADLVETARVEQDRNIWAVRMLYLHILKGGLCLRPPHSLVEHIGFDEEATNARTVDGWANPPLRPCPAIPSVWPEPIEHPDCRALAVRAYGARPQPPPLVLRIRIAVREMLPAQILGTFRRLKATVVRRISRRGRQVTGGR